jgi:hypothetical protein
MIGLNRGIFAVEWGVLSDLLLRKSANCRSKGPYFPRKS